MSKQFMIFVAIGVVALAAVVFGVFSSTKGSHLELKGKVMKVRTGALDPTNSAAVIDFRLDNPSDLPFVVRTIEITANTASGQTIDGMVVSKRDFDQLLQFNHFLGTQLNQGLTIRDKINPHETADRMVAATFQVPQAQLEGAKSVRLYIQDLDGPTFETVYPLK